MSDATDNRFYREKERHEHKYMEALRLLKEAHYLAGKSMGDAWYNAATALLSAPSAGLPLKMDTGGGDLEILRMALGNTAACLGDALATFNRLVGEEVFRNSTPSSATGECDYKSLYHELLFTVGNKWPGETRHQTALRYIQQAERQSGEASEAKQS